MLVAPSILSCDFAKMGQEITKVSLAGADLIHIDVMDGIFVPNITIGPCVIKALRKYSSLPFDVHLMIENPEKYIDAFCDAGANIISFHLESSCDVKQTIKKITARGVKPALAIKPSTPVKDVFEYLDSIYMILVMTVEPGFGGQKFMMKMLDKIETLKLECKSRGIDIVVEVDGGINQDTVSYANKSGVDVCVAGTAIFGAPDLRLAIDKLKSF